MPNWETRDTERLKEYYLTHLNGMREGDLKNQTVHGLLLLTRMPKALGSAAEALQASVDEISSTFDNERLKDEIDKMLKGHLMEGPEATYHATKSIIEAKNKFGDNHELIEKFKTEYVKFLSGVKDDVYNALFVLVGKIEGNDFYNELAKSIVVDTAGIFAPYLGSLKMVAGRFINRSGAAKARIQISSDINEAFLSFTDYIVEVTNEVGRVHKACREDARVAAQFLSIELPDLISEVNKWKIIEGKDNV